MLSQSPSTVSIVSAPGHVVRRINMEPVPLAVEESDDSDSASDSPVAPSGQRRHWASAAALGGVLLGAAALAAWAAQTHAGGSPALRTGHARVDSWARTTTTTTA